MVGSESVALEGTSHAFERDIQPGEAVFITLDGTVQLKIPPRSQSGSKLRLRGKGVARKEERGDLLVELSVRLPDQADDAFATAVAAASALYSEPVREEIRL